MNQIQVRGAAIHQKLTFGQVQANLSYERRKACYAVIMDEDRQQVAVVRTANGNYFFPGGGIEDGETPEACLKREVLEETGYTIVIGSRIGVAERFFVSPTQEPLLNEGTFYIAKLVNKSETPAEDDHVLEWIDVGNVDEVLFHEHHAWAAKQACSGTSGYDSDPEGGEVGMRVQRFDSVQLYIKKVEPFLERNEAANNLILGLLYLLHQKELKGEDISDTFLGAVDDSEGNLVLVVFMNRINLLVYGEGTEVDSAIEFAVSYLSESGMSVPGVVGPTPIAASFATKWASNNNSTPIVKMNQMIYRLDRVNPIGYAPGKLRLAESNDLELIADWILDFNEAIGERIEQEVARNKARENIESSSLYIWHDEVGVSMAKKSRPTRNGIVVTLVYTPPAYRNKGYASACVAALSQLLLDEGYTFCSLYTDLANPTSNKIYSAIGYESIQGSIMYRFE